MDLQYTDPETGLFFQWNGGPIISVYEGEGLFGEINVWDEEGGHTRIQHTQEAFEAECERWIAEDMT